MDFKQAIAQSVLDAVIKAFGESVHPAISAQPDESPVSLAQLDSVRDFIKFLQIPSKFSRFQCFHKKIGKEAALMKAMLRRTERILRDGQAALSA